jgi:spermidine synthase
MLRPRAERVLVIGLASGITAGSVTLHDAPQRIDVAEIEPAVVNASHFFDKYNRRPLEDPQVRLVINDARNHLQLAEDGTYDLVTSEPSNPWISGVSNLFTLEFLALGKRKPAPGGVWAQWLHCYAMDPDDLRSLLATFAATFEHVRLFALDLSDLLVVGSDAPLPMRASAVRSMLEVNPALAKDLQVIGMGTPAKLLALYAMDRHAVLELTRGIELNTDDNMRIEYSAPLHLYERTVAENRELLMRAADIPFDAVDEPGSLVALAAEYLDNYDLPRARMALRAARAESPDDPRLPALSSLLEHAGEADVAVMPLLLEALKTAAVRAPDARP